MGLPGQRGFAESAYGEVLFARGEVPAAQLHLETAADLSASGWHGAAAQPRAGLPGRGGRRPGTSPAGRRGPAAARWNWAAWCGTRNGSPCDSPGRRPREAAPALTDREWHIARLAATGVTSRLIGRQLYISPRTVEAHLILGSTAKPASPPGPALVALVARLDDTDR